MASSKVAMVDPSGAGDEAAVPNKAFMEASSAKARERARVKNGHLNTLSRLVLWSPKLHKKTDNHNWSVQAYGNFKWLPPGIDETTALTFNDRTQLRWLNYISPDCPKWQSYIFCRVEYGWNFVGIYYLVVHFYYSWKFNYSGLSEDDVWSDLDKVITDHTALMVTGNSPETAYRLVVRTWRECMFLKYTYTEVCKIWMEFDWKTSYYCSFLRAAARWNSASPRTPRSISLPSPARQETTARTKTAATFLQAPASLMPTLVVQGRTPQCW